MIVRIKKYFGLDITLTRHPNYLELSYNENGEDKQILIPLRKEQIYTAMQCEVDIVYRDDRTIRLKQDTAIPIMITAYDIGAKCIKIFNKFNYQYREFFANQPIEYI